MSNLKSMQKGSKQYTPHLRFIAGILFTFFIALLGYLLTNLPGFNQIGPLASAILLAVLYRQLFHYPEKIASGIAFTAKYILRLAIVLYGLKLNIQLILQEGVSILIIDLGVIIFSILLAVWLAKLLKADKNISLLVGVGTGICGAAAIAAIAPIIKAKNDETAMSIGIIALLGTIFAIIYTLLRPVIPFDDMEYGLWSGLSLHELAHVALAAEPAGEDSLAISLLSKLGRVFFLIPVSLVFVYLMNRKSKTEKKAQMKIEFPWFLVGFIITSLLGSYVFGPIIPVSENVIDHVANLSTWLLTAAMVGLGLNISLKDVRNRAMRPLIVITITSIALSTIVYLLILFFYV